MANAMDVQAVLTANTAGFDAPMQKSAAVGEATARAIAKANAEGAKATALAAKFAGDAVTEQSLRIVKAREEERVASIDYRKMQALARQGYIDESAGANAAAAALQRLQAAKLATATASRTEATAAEHAAISEQAAASAAVRSLEGNPGIRATERFLTTLPGVGAALQAVFPMIGATAFVGMLVRGGQELYDLEQKGKHAGVTIADAFDQVNSKLDVQNDDLRIQSDRLADELAKLGGHPGDGLRTALDEDIKRADTLLVSLKADRKELEGLFKENGVSTLQDVLSGVSGTGTQQTEMLRDQQNLTNSIRKANEDFKAAAAADDSPAAVKAAGEKRTAAIKQAYSTQIAAYTAEAARLAGEERQSRQDSAAARAAGNDFGGMAVDNSAKIANVSGRIAELQRMRDAVQLEEKIAAQQEDKGKLEGAKAAGTDQNKAAANLLKHFQAQVHEMQVEYGLSNKAEFDFWETKKSIFRAGSDQYNEVVARQASLAEEGAKRAGEQMKRAIEAARKLNGEAMPANAMNALDPWKRDDARAEADRADTANELSAIRQRTAARLAEMNVSEGLGRWLDREGAAVAMAAAHTAAYGQELERLEAKRKAIRDNPLLTNGEADRQKQMDALDRQIAQVQGGRRIEIAQDQYTIRNADDSATRGASDALRQFTETATDSARQMHDLVDNVIGGVNKTLVEELTTSHRYGPQFAWTHLGSSLAKSVAGTGLERLEGTAGKMLGFGIGGKRDGSSATSALFVQMAGGDTAAVATGGLMAALGGLFGGGAKAAASSGGGDAIISSMMAGAGASTDVGGVLQAALPLLSFAGFAAGGDYGGTAPFWVGEKGPELVVPNGASGSVVPNHKLAGIGGDTHVHVDARGAHDPAAVELAVQRGIQKAAPHIVAASVAAGDSRGRRTPTMNRR